MTIEFKQVTYAFPKEIKPVLKNVSFCTREGEFVSIIGKSGTGKSTMFKLLTGLLTPDEGDIRIQGESAKPGIVGYMPQKDLLLPWRTIVDNVMLASELQPSIQLRKDEAYMWLERVGLKGYEQAYPRELSGGMRQRAAFLRALLTGKDVLLLDEPFGALDAFTKKEMQSWLLSIWQAFQKTVLFITHDLEEAILLSDRIIILHTDQSLEEIVVPLVRPRDKTVLYSEPFLALKRELERKIANEAE